MRREPIAEVLLVPHAHAHTLKPMHLDGTLGDAFFSEERRDLDSLVPLELNHLAELLVVDECAVAGKFLLKRLQELLGVILFRQALQCGQRLPSVPLLDTDVDVVLLGADVVSDGITFVRERVVGCEVLNAHATGVCL